MKSFKEVIEGLDMTHAGGGGSGKHEYHKWGKTGQVDAWKKHVTSIHPKAKFSDKQGKLAKKTHAHVGDKEVGSYSHYNHSSSTLK